MPMPLVAFEQHMLYEDRPAYPMSAKNGDTTDFGTKSATSFSSLFQFDATKPETAFKCGERVRMTKIFMALSLLVCITAGCKDRKGEADENPGIDGQANASGAGLVIVNLVKTNAKVADIPGYLHMTELNPIVFQAKVTVRNESPAAIPLAINSSWSNKRGHVLKVLEERQSLYDYYLTQKRAGYPDVAEKELHKEDKSVAGLALPVPWSLLIEIKTSGTHDWMTSSFGTTRIQREVDPGTKQDPIKMYDDCESVMVPGNGTMTFTFWCRNDGYAERLTELRVSTIDPKGLDKSEAVLRRDAP
jgi:hypothetical protein